MDNIQHKFPMGNPITAVLSFQSPGVCGPKFDTPESDGFIADCDASLGQEIFNISMTEIESVVPPDCVANDFGGESMTLVGTDK